MIYNSFLKELSEEELSLIFLIGENAYAPLGMEVSYNLLKYLKRDNVLMELEFIKRQIHADHKEMVTGLQKKVSENI